MEKVIQGKVFVLGDDIDTDQIIPAQYLVYSLEKADERQKYGELALSGVPSEKSGLPEGNIPFVAPGEHKSEFQIIVSGKNFGCGSSREHAPAALEIAGASVVVAPSYARIFYRNAIDGGFVIPAESHEDLSRHFRTGDSAEFNLAEKYILNQRSGEKFRVKALGQVEAILEAGGIFAYARQTGMLEGA